MKRLYIANFPYETTKQDIIDFLAPRRVLSVRIITDKETHRSRGFGFVEMDSVEDANDAVKKLNGAAMGERAVRVAIADPKPERDAKRAG